MKRQLQPSIAENTPYSLNVKNKLEERNWRTIVELHKAQEHIEQVTTQNLQLSKQNEELNLRIQKILERNPNIWEYDQVLISLTPNKSKTLVTIENFYLGEYHATEVTIEASHGDQSLTIHGLSNSNNSPLLSAPSQENRGTITLKLGDTPSLNPKISQLSTTEWVILVSLLKMLNHLVDTQKLSLAKFDLPLILAMLEAWPAMLRYDKIENLGVLTEGKYSGLAVRMRNISFGTFTWPDLHFRLATVSSKHLFFQYPRLEFPETTISSFENWYSETTDHKGSRLELRYAHPEDFDASVWGRLSNKDKCLVTALVYFLPNLVTEFPASENYQAGQQWQALAECIRNIHVSHIRNNGF